MMRKLFWVIFWIVCILLPAQALSRFWRPLGDLFDTVFHPLWVHVVAHAFLYAVLALLLSRRIKPGTWRGRFLVLCLGLMIGCLQEGLQSLAPDHGLIWSDSAFDLLVDVFGMAVGLTAAFCLSLRGKKPHPLTS